MAVDMGCAGHAALLFVTFGGPAGFQQDQEGVCGDGPKLKGEGAIEDQNIDDEHPLTQRGHVLQHEALLDEEHTA